MNLNANRAAVRTISVFCAAFASAVALAAPSTDLAGSDARLSAQIVARLNADPEHFFRHVSVSVHGGIVRLSGYIWTTDSLDRAEAIARAAPGITGVVDRLQLERDTSRS